MTDVTRILNAIEGGKPRQQLLFQPQSFGSAGAGET